MRGEHPIDIETLAYANVRYAVQCFLWLRYRRVCWGPRKLGAEHTLWSERFWFTEFIFCTYRLESLFGYHDPLCLRGEHAK